MAPSPPSSARPPLSNALRVPLLLRRVFVALDLRPVSWNVRGPTQSIIYIVIYTYISKCISVYLSIYTVDVHVHTAFLSMYMQVSILHIHWVGSRTSLANRPLTTQLHIHINTQTCLYTRIHKNTYMNAFMLACVFVPWHDPPPSPLSHLQLTFP